MENLLAGLLYLTGLMVLGGVAVLIVRALERLEQRQ